MSDTPEWMTTAGRQTVENGYLFNGESIPEMYRRVARAAAQGLGRPDLEDQFFDVMWKGWLCPSSPVLSNLGTGRGLPISCFGVAPDDSVDSIFRKVHEQAMLSKNGGGVGIDLSQIRGRGKDITFNGRSDGVVPWAKVYDTATVSVSQGSTRRGASSVNLPIDHPDIEEFLRIRRPEGDPNRQCLNIHHCVVVTDEFMKRVQLGDHDARALWLKVLQTRLETGEPYIMFKDTVNRANPPGYKERGLDVRYTNICCLHGDTLVVTRQGPQRIADLCGQNVEVWDGNDWVETASFAPRGVDQLYAVTLSDGTVIKANGRHRWFAAKDDNEKYREVTTENLEAGCYLESAGRLAGAAEVTGWRKVISVEKLDEVATVYCPTIPTTGKFALACGVMTGNSEITLHSDADHSFVCCLSSLNVSKYDEWKNTDLVRLSIYFLDGVMQNFLLYGRNKPGLKNAVRFATKSRALGLGVLGWHTLLQQRMLPFDSMGAMQLNAEVFKHIHQKADQASRDLANIYGEPEWCKGTGRRNTHLLAVAPTMTNSTIVGQVSAGIEPIRANAYTFKTAKGTFFVQNPQLQAVLAEHGLDNAGTWNDIAVNQGSVQHLPLPENVKRVFLTAPEINQMAVVRQAAQRQPYVCQAQSLNLFFPHDVPAKWFNKVHLSAWEEGVKTLYYVRSESVLNADVASSAFSDDCKACEG